MVHYIKINNNKTITVNMSCLHPDNENNSMSGCSGNCENCSYGKAEMSIQDYMILQEKVFEKK